MAIVYQHRRLDNKEIFYIGIGKSEKRAFNKSNNRNKFWRNIINKTKYSIEILHSDITWQEACLIEKLLIRFYGRRDLDLGNLVNMTDGGEGILNVSLQTRKKISNALKGNSNFLGHKHSEENKKNWSKFHTGKKLSEETKLKISNSKKGNATRNKQVINIETCEIFESAKIVSKLYNIHYITLIRHLNGTVKVNKTKFKYLEEYDNSGI